MKEKKKKNIFDKITSTAKAVGDNSELLSKSITKIGKVTSDTVKVIGDNNGGLKDLGRKIVDGGVNVIDQAKGLKTPQIDATDILRASLKMPGVKVDRDNFIWKELRHKYQPEVVQKAVDFNPAYAGIERDDVDKIAREVINYETNRVSSLSFMAGLPGGFTMAATIPLDLAQYYGNVLIALQKLSYLYGFDNFELEDVDQLNDNTLNELLIFVGVMMGVSGANQGLKVIATSASKKMVTSIANKALTKGTVYPIVKKVAQMVGMKMTKKVFASGVSKIVPVVGGVLSGGITYATFKPSCYRLKKNLEQFNLSDPQFYVNMQNPEFVKIVIDAEYEEVITEVDESDIELEVQEEYTEQEENS